MFDICSYASIGIITKLVHLSFRVYLKLVLYYMFAGFFFTEFFPIVYTPKRSYVYIKNDVMMTMENLTKIIYYRPNEPGLPHTHCIFYPWFHYFNPKKMIK